MKKTLLILLSTLTLSSLGQTHTRKTRSDKGGTHKHSTAYSVKKAVSSSSKTPAKTTTPKTSSGTTTRKRK